MPKRTRPAAGFTLIELMIVVAVIGILAAIAYPSYVNYVRKSRRADAHAMLQAMQLAEEKWRLNHTTYTTTASDLTTVTTSEGGYYTLSFAAPSVGNTATGYKLTATPVAGKSQAGDSACATITIEQTTAGVTYGPSNTCWNK